MDSLIALLASGLIALLIYRLFSSVDLSVQGSAANRIARFASADRRGMTDRLGDSIVDRLGLSLDAWKHELRWAQLGGYYEGKTVGSVLGRVVLFVGAGLLYAAVVGFSPALLIAVMIAAYYPYMQLKGKADDVRQTVKRSLPEAAALIAAEMSAGSSAETAVTRAASLPGPLGNLLRQTAQEAQQTGRLIFSRDLIEGVLVAQAARYQMPQLEAFARQIDLVASRGAEGPRQMAEVARSLAREYRSDVMKASEQLGNKLLMPMTLYIFLPFMLAIFVPLMSSVFSLFK